MRFRDKLRTSLLRSGITGEIRSHGAKTNLESVKRVTKEDPYVTFGIQVVHQAVRRREMTYTQAVDIVAASLGTTGERFRQDGPGYIDPRLTAERFGQMLDVIDEVAAANGRFLVATAHPGSMVTYYSKLIAYITDRGGQVYRAPQPFKIAEYRWIDQIHGIHILSDEGNLLHTHDGAGFWQFLEHMPSLPDVVLADHGYAGAAINHGLKTIAIHDVDDPGIPLAAHLGADVLPIPMNDNQLNLPTAAALQAVLDDRQL